jgi:hypothetical protein
MKPVQKMDQLQLTTALSIEELQERNEFTAAEAEACCKVTIEICPA